jgi:hypothetical protein
VFLFLSNFLYPAFLRRNYLETLFTHLFILVLKLIVWGSRSLDRTGAPTGVCGCAFERDFALMCFATRLTEAAELRYLE